MKTQRFQNDNEYFEYIRKSAKSERILFYAYVCMGGLFLGLIADLALVGLKIHILEGYVTFPVMLLFSIIGGYKLKKSGWLEKNEDKAVASAKVRLEKRRKRLAELGAEKLIKKAEKNTRDVLIIGTYALLMATSLVILPKGSGLIEVIVALVIACAMGTVFTLSKYFRILLGKILEKPNQDMRDGYLYYKT